jgi:hypothetical protein
MEQSVDALQALKKSTSLAGLAEVTDKQLYKHWNLARNAAKHHNEGKSETVVLNLFDKAYWMIRRASENAKSLLLQINNGIDFEKWIIVNINLDSDHE